MKTLILDIETAPMLGSVWGLWDQNISLDMLEKDWYILSFSCMWFDGTDKEIFYKDNRDAPDIENDIELLKELHKYLDDADIVIAHNGRKFDIPKINARFALNGLTPPSPYRIVDTLQIAKRNFSFTSNKLEYLSDKLCPKGKKKLKHKEFPGFILWKECIAGNKNAWDEMERYNKMDVLSLKSLYKVLMPWNKQKPNVAVFKDSNKKVCPCCGSSKVQSRGYYHTNITKYQRFYCNDCKSWSRSKVMETDKEVRENMLVNVTY